MKQKSRFHTGIKRPVALALCALMLLTSSGAALADRAFYDGKEMLSAVNIDSLYTAYGLVRNQENNRLYYQGRLVRSFEGYNPYTGEDYHDRSGGEVDLYLAYDAFGQFKGIGVYTQAEFELRTDSWLMTILIQELTGAYASTAPGRRYAYQSRPRNYVWPEMAAWFAWEAVEEPAAQAEQEVFLEEPISEAPEATVPPLEESPDVREALSALEKYFLLWRNQAFDKMVPLTTTEWQEAARSPVEALEAIYGAYTPVVCAVAHTPLLKEKNLICFEACIQIATENQERAEERYFSIILRKDDKTRQWAIEPETLRPNLKIEDDRPPVADGQPPEVAGVVLTGYMKCWENQDYEGMLEYILPSWLEVHKTPQRQLSWNHSGFILNDWVITSFELLSEDSISIELAADLTKNTMAKTQVIRQYTALLICVDGHWYMDPDSMRDGTVLVLDSLPEMEDRG